MSKETTRPRLIIERADSTVTLIFQCTDIYAAMRFYDQVCDGAAEGPKLRIDVEIANAGQY